MVESPRISRTTFADLVEPMYRQLVKWNMSPEEKTQHILDRYELMKGFKPLVVQEAVRQLLLSSSVMPTPSAMVQACADARIKLSSEYFKANPLPPVDSTECQCRCGGKRWAKWLPPDPQYPHVVRTRDFTTCLKKRTNLPPKGPCYADERGVPVFGSPTNSPYAGDANESGTE